VKQTSQYYLDRVAVVTGGASGIGLALAETMLSYGAKKVALADINNENLKREAARLNSAYDGRVLAVRCNVTNEEDVQGMIREAFEFGGRIDILFNNAGAGFSGAFEKQTNQDWEKAFALNFYGALYGVRAVLLIMRGQGSGHIVNTISGIAFAPMAYQTMYAATKAALNGFTLALRYELWDDNVRVTSATPGTAATAIWQGGIQGAPPGAQSAQQSAQTILAGVANNERIVLGDEHDVSGAKNCFSPDASSAMDNYLLKVARKRRSGEWTV
jgi:NAD(P)-dependent dehydrogenase (short-subunit alcohol dehydrogenase family)